MERQFSELLYQFLNIRKDQAEVFEKISNIFHHGKYWLACHRPPWLCVRIIKTFIPLKSLALSVSSGELNPGELETLLTFNTTPVYIQDQSGPVRTSMPISGRVRAARGELMLGEELGLHRSNRLPWKRIFLESCLRVSQMELTSCWQSDSAVRAHVWKASQWLWQTKNHRQISSASAM